MHSAVLAATEGASISGTTAARADRAEGTNREAAAAAVKAEASTEAARASVELAATKGHVQSEVAGLDVLRRHTRALLLVGKLHSHIEITENFLRDGTASRG